MANKQVVPMSSEENKDFLIKLASQFGTAVQVPKGVDVSKALKIKNATITPDLMAKVQALKTDYGTDPLLLELANNYEKHLMTFTTGSSNQLLNDYYESSAPKPNEKASAGNQKLIDKFLKDDKKQIIRKNVNILFKLDPAFWKKLGSPVAVLNTECEKDMKKAAEGTGENSDQTQKRIQQRKLIIIEVRTAIEAAVGADNMEMMKFVSLGNLMKDDDLRDHFQERTKILKWNSLPKMNDKMELVFDFEPLHKPIYYKMLTVDEINDLLEPRYEAIFKLQGLITAKTLPTKMKLEVTEGNYGKLHPKMWATLISPRVFLNCNTKKGQALTPERIRELAVSFCRIWELRLVEEANKLDTSITFTNTTKFSIERYDKDGAITAWWKMVMPAYQKFHKVIIEAKDADSAYSAKSSTKTWTSVEPDLKLNDLKALKAAAKGV